ncbi:hypothetical protein N7448_010683 [Penicillium atrosanguineum]|uniref:Altered inheritance of mitochondria protein 11 n=1 Tax=Penicillium atrosanguineum TaxID=1132637 RepID=A0A9W9PMC7_9EURO|nr:uncharacterized protein N7443_007905 [Penicillium atrosanguineum]KAJ5118975.1 hypothetical protein N7526_010612 [Penicillium atrosanguineum]KAJ5120014.1 hypothetical protein N7448_010683 [Penicillium atrosanguineum]KAJ5297012.1 hypothetical protein N7443_007905 [Penicillium atrosanguineum]KAJ5299772.1 hypothetical protein N7476_011329 [Penicillium atrosanguineum]
MSIFGWGSSSKSDASASTPQESTSSTQDAVPSSAPTLSEPSTQLSQQSKPKDNTGLKLFLGGIAFSAFSVFITRRANIRKQIACIPPFYSSSIYHQPNANGAMEAFEALNLATINVFSFGMLTVGGTMYALDINGIEDARKIMRSGLEGSAQGKSDEDLENDVQEWVASVLGNRFEKQLEKERAKKRDVTANEEN